MDRPWLSILGVFCFQLGLGLTYGGWSAMVASSIFFPRNPTMHHEINHETKHVPISKTLAEHDAKLINHDKPWLHHYNQFQSDINHYKPVCLDTCKHHHAQVRVFEFRLSRPTRPGCGEGCTSIFMSLQQVYHCKKRAWSNFSLSKKIRILLDFVGL